jgi:hypothetical protein
MSAYLVIERPDHSPRVLGTFTTRQDAERARETLVAAQPDWATFVSVRAKATQRARDNGRRAPRSFVGLWLVALLAVDVVIAYALYLAARALLDLV